MTLREEILRNSGILFEDDEAQETPVAEESYLDELKKLINGELCAEWQYALAHQAVVGKENLSYLQDEFEEHEKDEHEHYEELSDALLQRGGKMELNLSKIVADALPKTEELTDFSTEYLRDFFERAESNAIKAYQAFYEKIEEKDKDLADIINSIISDERDHKLNMQKIKG